MSQLRRYQKVYIQPDLNTSSKCHNHNVIKQFICSQTNTRPANATITTLSKSLYTARLKHVQQMEQSQRYQTVYMQPNKYAFGKCHNHNVTKQFTSATFSIQLQKRVSFLFHVIWFSFLRVRLITSYSLPIALNSAAYMPVQEISVLICRSSQILYILLLSPVWASLD